MYRYDLYSSGTEKEAIVLDCYWSDGAKCQTTKGYTFDGTVSNRLTVVIPLADETYEGRYECQVQPSDPTNVKQCRLTLKAGVRPTPSPGPTTSATLTIEADSDEEEDTNAAAVVVPIIILIIIGVVGAVVAYKYREGILRRFPFLPFWRTQEDDTSNVERGAMHYGNTDGSRQFPAQNPLAGHSDEHPEHETESHLLLPNQQSASVPETDRHLSERHGGHLPEHAETPAREDEDPFSESFQSLEEMVAHSDTMSASHDTITTKSGKDAASNAVDTEDETNKNSPQASPRDSGGSFHHTSTKTTEDSIIPAPEPPVATLICEKKEETHMGNKEDVVRPDIGDVEASLQTSDPINLTIQATAETEHNKNQTTEVNSEETHPANDGDITNTGDPAALLKEKEKDKHDSAKTDAKEQFNKRLNDEPEKASETDVEKNGGDNTSNKDS